MISKRICLIIAVIAHSGFSNAQKNQTTIVDDDRDDEYDDDDYDKRHAHVPVLGAPTLQPTIRHIAFADDATTYYFDEDDSSSDAPVKPNLNDKHPPKLKRPRPHTPAPTPSPQPWWLSHVLRLFGALIGALLFAVVYGIHRCISNSGWSLLASHSAAFEIESAGEEEGDTDNHDEDGSVTLIASKD
jgi:hypothetical protein